MLQELLSEKKTAILKRWFHMIVETYPADSADFLKREKNQFANPIGYTTSTEIESIYDELVNGMDRQRLCALLDKIIRIRAVQQFSPSQAVVFVMLLKKAVREELGNEISKSQAYDELLEFENRIDNLALFAFDIYMECREKISDIKANEIRNRSKKLLERMNIAWENPGHACDLRLVNNVDDEKEREGR